MAKREEDEKDETEDDRDEDSDASGEDPSARDEADHDEDEGEDESEEEQAEAASAEKASSEKKVIDAEYEDEDEDEDESDEQQAARSETALEAAGDASEEEALPTQLGANKYVYSAFFTAALIAAYVLGKSIHGIWATLSNRDFFALRFPWATSIHDDTKTTYSMVVGGLIAIVLAIRTVKKPSLRQWADEVAGELVKVKWPTRKEVQNSTVVVLATSAVAVTYLFLLDRFFGFLTDRIYSVGG
jgi:preprotein translocase subunit SecE